jgi:hypothetical protein
VHLGLHKTGTTAVQNYLTQNSYGLYRADAVYPTTGRHPLASTQHALLAAAFVPTALIGIFALAGSPDRDLLGRAVRQEIELSGRATAVLSSEEFSRLAPGDVEEFAREFRDYDIEPVIFLRNFAQSFEAYYGTLLLTTTVTDPEFERMLPTDLFAPLQAWAAVAAGGRVTVVDYHASATGNSVADFLTATGIASPYLPDPAVQERLNPSLPPAWVALVRELRRYGIDEDNIRGLLYQLGRVRVDESQTALPADARKRLQESYVALHTALRAAPFVRWIGDATEPRALSEATEISDLVAAVFALGRAIGNGQNGDASGPDAL